LNWHLEQIEKIESKGQIKLFKRDKKKRDLIERVIKEIPTFPTGETITGKVADENGEALIGANIVLKSDKSKGTTTDLD